MSRYSFIIYILLLFFTNCSAKESRYQINYSQKSINKQTNQMKADFYYMAGLDCEYRGDFGCAKVMNYQLYKLTKQSKFLINATRFALFMGDYSFFKKHIDILKEQAYKSSEVASFLVPYYLRNKKIKEAERLAKFLLKKNPSEKNYEILAALYTDSKKYKKAKKLIDSYIKKHDCSIKLCAIKLLINAREADLNGSLKTLNQLYKKTKNISYQEEIVKLLLATKQIDRLEKFLEKSSLPKEDLLELYATLGKYKKAERLAYKLYKEKKDFEYLAKSAIYLYEAEYKNNPTILDEVIKRFEKSVYKLKDALYYNYYGYLLIDHDKNIKKGIELIKKALKMEPESDYYLDSLGWGYYKLGKCREAEKIFKKLKNKEQEEIKEHIKKVKECLKK